MARIPSTQAFRALETFARLGSIWQTAQELNLNKIAVSHQLRQLEWDLAHPRDALAQRQRRRNRRDTVHHFNPRDHPAKAHVDGAARQCRPCCRGLVGGTDRSRNSRLSRTADVAIAPSKTTLNQLSI